MNAFSTNVNDGCPKVLRTCELLHCSGGAHVSKAAIPSLLDHAKSLASQRFLWTEVIRT